MISVAIQPDRRQVAEAERLLEGVKNGMDRAMAAATRRTINTARTRVIRAVTSSLAIAASKLYQPGNRRRPIQMAYLGTGGAMLKVTGRRMPLGRFKARQTRRGVSYQLDKGGGRKNAEGAFVPKLKSGYEGAFRRRGPERLPLVELFGPSVPHVAENRPAVQDLLRVDAAAIFAKNLASQVDRLLQRRRNA